MSGKNTWFRFQCWSVNKTDRKERLNNKKKEERTRHPAWVFTDHTDSINQSLIVQWNTGSGYPAGCCFSRILGGGGGHLRHHLPYTTACRRVLGGCWSSRHGSHDSCSRPGRKTSLSGCPRFFVPKKKCISFCFRFWIQRKAKIRLLFINKKFVFISKRFIIFYSLKRTK